MDPMEINIELPENFFEQDEWHRLQDFFNKESIEDLNEDLKKIMLSALKEYKEMFIGRGFPSRADEIREYRLFYLIKNYFKGFPSEAEVSDMFQETQTRSKSLIRNVLTRFRFDLKDEIDNVLKDTLCSARLTEDENQEYRVTIQSDIIVEEFNRIINKKAPKCKVIKKVSGTGRNYSISEDSYDKLKMFLIPEDCPEEGD